jgi:hypothetical protein|tara:strand:+ start:198 stop:929 length:732 start_codon:yes stop_codon:yes gene_type:complete
MFQKYQTVAIAFFFAISSYFPLNIAESQPKSLMGNVFFYKDIANFGGTLLKTPISKNKIIVQSFNAECSNLNRIILPFYLEKKGTGILTFNLYQNNIERKLIFTTSISVEDFPPPKEMGTYEVDGVFHYIWIPSQTDSRNKSYLWELRTDTISNQVRTGLYMNHKLNPQLQSVIIDGLMHENTYAAFYSYCQYRFEWEKILETTWDRFKREKIFLVFYLILISGIIIGIRLTGRGNSECGYQK